MALSTYLNCDTLQALNHEMGTFRHPQPDDESFSLAPSYQLVPHYSSDDSFLFASTFLDSYTDPIQYPQPYYYEPPVNLSDILQTGSQQYNSLPSPKRHRCCFDNQYSSLDFVSANFFDGFSQNLNCSLQCEELLPELLFSAVPEFKIPEAPSPGNCEGNIDDYHGQWEKLGNEKMVSPQRIAARARRRKISEKTQELGNLIPNGNGMNTAEMFSAAAKYVKFLQAQIDMLQLINILEEEDKEATPNEDLKVLLGSTSVQEKLYLEEKCFFPKQFVATLTNDPQLQSKAPILKELNHLIAKNI